MTQPIQEPSTDKALQGMAYARDQIFRRPPPLGGGPVQVLRAYRALDPVTISGTGTGATFTWDIWENCNDAIFDPHLIGDEMDALDLLLPGKVTICWGVKYEVALSDSSAMQLIDDEPAFGPNTYSTVHARSTNGVDSMQGFPSLMIQTFSRSYPTTDPFSSGNQFPVRFTWKAAQISGTSRDIEFAFLDVGWEPADICEGPIES